jgi:hypothetical protein
LFGKKPFYLLLEETVFSEIKRSKLYAGIMHGHFMSVFTYSSQLEGGSNVQIEVLHRMLEQYKSEGKKLPPTLWVQMDNTCK